MFCIVLAGAALGACNKASKSEPAPSAKTAAAPTQGKTLGAGVKLTESTSIDTILKDPKAWNGKTVRVDGMITDVCPKRGCWMELAGEQPGNKLRFKVVDGEMVFPMEAKGQRATAEGVVAVHELSLEDSKAYAEEEAKEHDKPFDPASVTQPMVIARIDGTGAVIHDK